MIAVLTAHPFGLRGKQGGKKMKKGKSGDTEKVVRGLSMGQKDKGRQRKNGKGKVKGGGQDPHPHKPGRSGSDGCAQISRTSRTKQAHMLPAQDVMTNDAA